MSSLFRAIQGVVIFTGFGRRGQGVYSHNVQKRIDTFNHLNQLRRSAGQREWSVIPTRGEHLVNTLRERRNPSETLLVIPAGQSTMLDTVFKMEHTEFIKNYIFQGGAKAYLNCGSAYWSSKRRIYHGVCTVQPTQPKTIVKDSVLPLFEGTAEGPLCRFPGSKYAEGFFTDAVTVAETDSPDAECTVLLSGGGSFQLPSHSKETIQKIVRYAQRELNRLEIPKQDHKKWETAGIRGTYGKGSYVSLMFHPYYNQRDIDPIAYERAFPDSKTNWREVHGKLSSEETRMKFLKRLLDPLENTPSIDSEIN